MKHFPFTSEWVSERPSFVVAVDGKTFHQQNQAHCVLCKCEETPTPPSSFRHKFFFLCFFFFFFFILFILLRSATLNVLYGCCNAERCWVIRVLIPPLPVWYGNNSAHSQFKMCPWCVFQNANKNKAMLLPCTLCMMKVFRLHTKQSWKLFRKGVVQIPSTNRRHFFSTTSLLFRSFSQCVCVCTVGSLRSTRKICLLWFFFRILLCSFHPRCNNWYFVYFCAVVFRHNFQKPLSKFSVKITLPHFSSRYRAVGAWYLFYIT